MATPLETSRAGSVSDATETEPRPTDLRHVFFDLGGVVAKFVPECRLSALAAASALPKRTVQ